MKLLVDIGNSRVKWALLENAQLTRHGNGLYSRADLPANLAKYWQGLPAPEAVVVSSVGGETINTILTGWVEQQWQQRPEYVRVRPSACGVTNGYTDYTQLGIDRWLALVAVWSQYKGPACIVDCGSAITIDTLDNTGRHTGGLILPGLRTMHMALHRLSSALPDTVAVVPGAGFARSTEDGVASGCLLGAVSLIDRMADILLEENNGQVELVITGGDAEVVQGRLKAKFNYRPHIVLDGLAITAGMDE